MADYRRYRVPGGTWFFTVVVKGRARLFAASVARQILGDKIRECQTRWPFEVNAIVLLPDHLHAILSLPTGDTDYSQRWGWIKKEFTKEWLASGGAERPISSARRSRGDRRVWQPRFWEHLLDDDDFQRHFDYVHYNPVKHGLVNRPIDWPYSSFHRWVREGVYPPDWGCGSDSRLDFDDLDDSAME